MTRDGIQLSPLVFEMQREPEFGDGFLGGGSVAIISFSVLPLFPGAPLWYVPQMFKHREVNATRLDEFGE